MAVIMPFVNFPFHSQCQTLSLAQKVCKKYLLLTEYVHELRCEFSRALVVKGVDTDAQDTTWGESPRKSEWSADHKQHPPSLGDLKLVPFAALASSPFLCALGFPPCSDLPQGLHL